MKKNKKITKQRTRRALISVSDKTGLADFAKELVKMGFELISTGGTAKALKNSGIRSIDISKVTGFPEMLDGRVKTLHPKIHGGLLALRSNKKHMATIKKHKIQPIDMVVVNLYPFEKTVADPKVKFGEAIENIDIGGPSMIRSASKNFESVAVVTNPSQYSSIIDEMKKSGGEISRETKAALAREVFRLTSTYDGAIFNYLSKQAGEKGFPAKMSVVLEKVQDLRYGENPHQQAAFYREAGYKGVGIAEAKQLHGKELSYNNIYDVDAAWNIVNYFAEPTVAIIKHTNPCGAAQGKNILEAYKKAYECDTVSAYGGIIAANGRIDGATADEIAKLFVEAVIAPEYDPDALEKLKGKKNIRILQIPKAAVNQPITGYDFKKVRGGFLVQDPDNAELNMSDIKVVTKKEPMVQEAEDLFFAFGLVKYVKSNAIVVVKNKQAVGVGAGQMSRVESTEIALKKASRFGKGGVMASDAFFPFRDSVDLAAKHGITAIIEPGGSVHDEEVIASANEHNIALVFTGIRHFRH